MDYISEMFQNQQVDLHVRLAEYETSVMLVSHNGEIPEIGGFNVHRVTTVADVLSIASPAIAVLGDDAADLAYIIGARPTAIGVNMLRVVDIPDQSPSQLVNSELSGIREVSLIRILNDIADEDLIRRNMTQEELDASATKKQESQRQDKHGNVKPLTDYDFDNGVEDGEGE